MTNLFEVVSDEEFEDAHAVPDAREITLAFRTTCPACEHKLDNGYCRNDACSIDAPIITLPCMYCGHCETPGKCVKSVMCPLCWRVAGHPCINPSTHAIDSYHEERWLEAKRLHGTYYK